ncbi:MAG: hypothetical protein MJY95_01850 [Bacteroidaceae bacterium]|nr:hypothetical protein [Bacteroidaceae bacterium]
MKRTILSIICLIAVSVSVGAQGLVIPECHITSVPKELGISDYYSKYVNCNGIHIVSSWRVPDSCLVQAHKTLYAMTSFLAPEILKAMTDKNTRVAVMARYEGTTDLPEHRYLLSDTVIHWDLRARGLEGTLELPMTSCAEENILAYQIDPYHAEDILIHEFAHSIHLIGIKQVHPEIDDELQSLMDQAIAEGKYTNTYALENFIEYWAEGVQDWFNVNAEMPLPDGKHNWVNTREDLKKYDPRLYNLIARYFPETDEQISKHPKVNLYKKDDYKAFRKMNKQKKLNINIPECEITAVPTDLKSRLHLSDYYKKYINCNGIHIMSSHKAPDSALVQAYKTVYAMTSMLPKAVHDAMTRVDTRVVVMGRYEATVQIPEHASLVNDTSLNWNLRARGLGGTIQEPITSCAEENILAYQIDKYHAEDILIHEFAHSIHLIGIVQVDRSINQKLRDLLRQARAEGKWENTYAANNFEEYWAEGVQDWFNVNAEMPYADGKHNWVNTREDLKKYDPRLYALISQYFPETNAQIGKHKKVNLYKR